MIMLVTFPIIFKTSFAVLGYVYEAITPEGKVVALKQAHITRKIAHPMLLHEACALSLLAGHPSIPAVYAWGRSQYFEYLTLDLLGTSVCDLAKHKPVKLEEVLPLLNEMVRLQSQSAAL